MNFLEKNTKELHRMARISTMEFIDSLPDNIIQFNTSGIDFGLDLKSVIDVQQELDRLDKELSKLQNELIVVDKKLSNQKFIRNAPLEIIEKQKKIKEELSSNIERIISSKDKMKKLF